MEYGSKIYELRKSKSFSQEEVANKLNISRQSISLWETNQASPSMENLISLARLFNVSLDELVGINETNRVLEEKAKFTVSYKDDKATIYRRDFKYLKNWREALRLFVFLFLLFFGTGMFFGAFEIGFGFYRVIFILVSLLCYLISYIIYPRYILKNLKNILAMNYDYNITLHSSYLSYNKTNSIKTKSNVYEYKYFDYYIEKPEYIIVYLLKGDPIYLPVNGEQTLKEYVSVKVEKRKRPRSFWNNRQ